MFCNILAKLEKQGKHKLCDRSRAVDRHVRDRNATFASRCDIDAVISGRCDGDEQKLAPPPMNGARIGALFVTRMSAPRARTGTSSGAVKS